MKPFTKLLRALTAAIPRTDGEPVAPRQALEAWSAPSDSHPDLTLWGAYLRAGDWEDPANPVIWSSVNLAPLDRTRQLFPGDAAVRNSMPVRLDDRSHVENVHAHAAATDARSRFLSASFLSEELEKGPHAGLAQLPWLLQRDLVPTADLVSVGLDPATGMLHLRPPEGAVVPSPAALEHADLPSAADRYSEFWKVMSTSNTGAPARTAQSLLRVPAGRTSCNQYLVEFFHTQAVAPSKAQADALIEATELAAAAVQSVLAPAIIRHAEETRQLAFFSSVVSHDINNWRLNGVAAVKLLRRRLSRLALKKSASAQLEEVIQRLEFQNALVEHLLAGFVWTAGGNASMQPVPLKDVVDWLSGLRHPRLKGGCLILDLPRGGTAAKVSGEVLITFANLIQNAVANNSTGPSTPVQAHLRWDDAILTASVASIRPFEMEPPPPLNEIPRRGLGICHRLALNSRHPLEPISDPVFGTRLQFKTPLIA